MVKVSVRTILVAVDGSETSKRAVTYGIHIAKVENAAVRFLHVIEDIKMGGVIGARAKYGDVKLVEGYNRFRKESAKEWMDSYEEHARKDDVRAVSDILYDKGKSITGMIVDYADQHDVDLVVIGTRGHKGLKRLILGSTAYGVAMHAHCPVLIAR